MYPVRFQPQAFAGLRVHPLYAHGGASLFVPWSFTVNSPAQPFAVRPHS